MTVVGKDFLFIHVPKCAGKSLSKRLGGVTRGVPSHAPLSFFTNDVRAGRFAFGFVRNPWDRMVSAYVFITTKTPRPSDDADHRALATEIGFKRWLTETGFFVGDELTWPEPPAVPFQKRSQMYWLDGCDFIGRTETIDADMQIIDAHIQRSRSLLYRLRFGGKVERRNTTRRSDYRQFYDAETHDFIAGHFAPEIARFGYRFDPD